VVGAIPIGPDQSQYIRKLSVPFVMVSAVLGRSTSLSGRKSKLYRNGRGQGQIIGLGRLLEQPREKGVGLVAVPFSISNGFTHEITTFINQKRRRKRPCVVKFERFCVVV
jgi:hypothetical protein